MVVTAITLTVNGSITFFSLLGTAQLAAPCRLAATSIAAVWVILFRAEKHRSAAAKHRRCFADAAGVWRLLPCVGVARDARPE